MNQNSAGARPLNQMIDVDLPFEELERLARVDALLRVIAAHDRSDAIAPSGRSRTCRFPKRKEASEMVRALSLILLGVTAVGVVATPGLAAAALLIVPFAVLVAVWWIALGAATPGGRREAVVRVRQGEFLGPGGQDDPFSSD